MKTLKYLVNNPGIISSLVLLGLILYLPYMYLWDEDWYMMCIRDIQHFGLTLQYLDVTPAAPMHAVIYYLLLPITHGNPLIARLINYIMCFIICFIVYKTIRLLKIQQIKEGEQTSYVYTLSMFAIPSFFVLGFFALTEAPCLIFYSLSVFFLLKTVTSNKNILLSLIGGILLGFAVLTRQLLLPCILIPYILLFYRNAPNRFKIIALYTIGTLIICLPVFYIWKGVVPRLSVATHQNSALTPKHLLLSYGYAFFYFLFIIPVYTFQFIAGHKKWIIAILVGLGIITSFFISDPQFLPMSGFLPRFFSSKGVYIIARLYFVTTCVLAYFLVYFFYIEFKRNKHDFTQVFLLLSMLCILSTPVLLHAQFSSRYPMQFAPMMMIFCYNRSKPTNTFLQTSIFIISLTINLISVITFLY